VVQSVLVNGPAIDRNKIVAGMKGSIGKCEFHIAFSFVNMLIRIRCMS